jgi:hypothetical protein
MISPNKADLEIQKLFSEVLQLDIVALGKKLNEATKMIKELQL